MQQPRPILTSIPCHPFEKIEIVLHQIHIHGALLKNTTLSLFNLKKLRTGCKKALIMQRKKVTQVEVIYEI